MHAVAEGKTAARADPEIADWCRENGDANNARELRRIWDKAGETDDEIDRLIIQFNSKYMVVNEAGKAVIYAPAEDPILHRHFYYRMNTGDLTLLYRNRRVQVGTTEEGIPIMLPVAAVWLDHRDRKQYIDSVTFDPSGRHSTPDTLNLWQGFAVTPRSGSWEKVRLHIRDVICSGNHDAYIYIITGSPAWSNTPPNKARSPSSSAAQKAREKEPSPGP